MEGDSSHSGTSAPRLCIFCRKPGPQYSVPSHKKENIRSEAHISKIWLCNVCLENKNFDGIGNLNADGETDDHGRLMPKALYLPNDKSHVKSCWTRLRTALDSLYVKILQESEEGLVNSIENLVVSQPELVNCAHICAEEDSVQLLQRIDAQAQKYVLQCKQRLIVHSLSKKFGKLGPPTANHMKIPWADSYFLKLALGYWEKYSLVSRAAAIILRPMQEICSVHWGTQTRCIFHRAIYSHIDIQDRLRTISNAVQVSLQEAAQAEELSSWNVRGTMRRYRKFEEEMTKASQDREPESCRYLDSVPLGTYGRKSHYMCNFLTEDWHFYSDEEDTDADDEEEEEDEDEEESKENLLLNDSSDCTDTLSDALSEEDEEIEETDEEEFENEMKTVQGEFKKMLMVHEGLSREVSKCLEEYRAAHSSEDSADEFVRQHIAKKKREEKAMKKRIMQDDYESSSTETSISTESEDSSEETEELCSDEDTMAVWKVIEHKFTSQEAKRQLGLSPSPSDIPNELLNNTPKKKKNIPEKSTGELFKNIVEKNREKSKLNKSSANGSKLDNGKCKVDKAVRPVAATKSNGNSTPSKKVEKENEETHEQQHTCMSDHEDGEHDHYSEHHPCHCVHCELLGNTPNSRGNFRDEQARARLRKKLEKRKQASGQPQQCPDTKCQQKCDAASTTRQAGDESSSPTLSTRSTVSSQRDSRTGTPQAKTAKRMPFSFSTAMDLRPVRSSTSSKIIESNNGDNDGKREWVDCAYEDILNMCHDKQLKNTPQNSSLNSVQSWLRTAIKDRLDAQKDVKLPVHQIIAEEVIAAEEAEKAAEEAKRLKKKKKKQAAKQRKDEIKRVEEAKLEAERRAQQKIDDEEAERKAQEKREEEEMENVFTPVDNIEGLDPDDRDVERFKRFCLEFVPKFPRLKIPLQSLNLPPLVLPQ